MSDKDPEKNIFEERVPEKAIRDELSFIVIGLIRYAACARHYLCDEVYTGELLGAFDALPEAVKEEIKSQQKQIYNFWNQS